MFATTCDCTVWAGLSALLMGAACLVGVLLGTPDRSRRNTLPPDPVERRPGEA